MLFKKGVQFLMSDIVYRAYSELVVRYGENIIDRAYDGDIEGIYDLLEDFKNVILCSVNNTEPKHYLFGDIKTVEFANIN